MRKYRLYGKLSGNVSVFYRSSIVVIRIDSSNNLCDSKPCEECIDIIRLSGIKKIYYSVINGIIIEKTSMISSKHKSYAQKHLKHLIH